MNFGAFAGGLAQGGMSTYLNLSQNKRAQDEQDARNAERLRQENDRAIAKETLGKAGTTKIVANPDTAETEAVGMSVTPTPYSRAQAYEDYARQVSDPAKGLPFAQLAEQESNKERVKGIIAAANNWGKNPEAAISQISQIYSGVPDGFETSPVKLENGGIGVRVVNAKTGQLQVYDASTPQMQNMLTLRALAAVDPTTYMPMFQTAMKNFADDQRGNAQVNNTKEYQDGSLKLGGRNADIAEAHYLRSDETAAYNADTARQTADQTGDYQQGTLGLYRDGLKGGTGGGRGASYDPNKADANRRAENAAAVKAAEGFYTFPDADGKPVKHPGAFSLASIATQKLGAEGMNQVMQRVHDAAAAQATDSATGLVDQNKFLPIYNKGVQAALAQLTAGGGTKQAATGLPASEAPSGSERPSIVPRKMSDKPAKNKVPDGPTSPAIQRGMQLEADKRNKREASGKITGLN